MRIARFSRDDTVAYGVVQEAAPDGVASAAIGPDTDGLTIAELQGHPFGVGTDSVRYTGQSYPVADVRLLAPVLPTKVVAIGKNYADHAREMGGEPPRPSLFVGTASIVPDQCEHTGMEVTRPGHPAFEGLRDGPEAHSG